MVYALRVRRKSLTLLLRRRRGIWSRSSLPPESLFVALLASGLLALLVMLLPAVLLLFFALPIVFLPLPSLALCQDFSAVDTTMMGAMGFCSVSTDV